jgi:hypothetical protein
MKLSGCRKAKHLQKRKAYDRGDKDDGHNDIEFSRFYIVNALPNAQIFNAKYYI